ncbi:MAG: phosphoenolpyruvate--protein phosphotransferase [Bacteroidales bacterium]|jgi:phosphotransferase system enzyme I (PtsI)|nr:phosphoenolpyruvate--protein phosphotransferase [Bacteroidales bacterium]
MKQFFGQVASEGIGIGVVLNLSKNTSLAKENAENSLNNEFQMALYLRAKEIVNSRLSTLYNQTLDNLGQEMAKIVLFEQFLLEDDEFDGKIQQHIADGKTAQEAIKETQNSLYETFKTLKDSYLAERIAEIADLSTQLENSINGDYQMFNLSENTVIIATDVAVSQLLTFDKPKICGIVTTKGSLTTHTSIIAQTAGIPLLIQVDNDILNTENGTKIAIDTFSKSAIVQPTDYQVNTILQKIKETSEEKLNQERFRGCKTQTKDGFDIRLYANIGSVEDAKMAYNADTEGVGLLRSEFLFINRNDYPSEEEQYNTYWQIVQELHFKPLIIRTIDIGTDKNADYFNLPTETNPALGYRAIRICLDRPQLFENQLRAIYRAAQTAYKQKEHNPIAIMFPMIVACWEVEKCLQFCQNIENELNINFKVAKGIMIETPAAVLIANDLAKMVDFFSVGSNDLAQYILAIDRQCGNHLEKYVDFEHPALLKALKMTAQAAIENNIWCGICGELATYPNLTEFLIREGYTEFSVNYHKILKMREIINNITRFPA